MPSAEIVKDYFDAIDRGSYSGAEEADELKPLAWPAIVAGEMLMSPNHWSASSRAEDVENSADDTITHGTRRELKALRSAALKALRDQRSVFDQ